MEISLVRPLPNAVGSVSQRFGETLADYAAFGMLGHNGVDYEAPAGTPVRAAHAGACRVGYDANGYGNFVRVVTGDYQTIYAHLEAVQVDEDQTVEAGAQLGRVGSSGSSSGPHLHFGLKIQNGANPGYFNWIDPLPFRDL